MTITFRQFWQFSTFKFAIFILFLPLKPKAQVTEWRLQAPFPVSQDLYDVKFFTSKIGIAVGRNNTILRTTDGGLNWKSIALTNSNQNFQNIAISGDSTAWVSTGVTFAFPGKLLYTSDRGMTWVEKVIPGESQNIGYVAFLSKEIGFANTWKAVYRTKNGGYTWERIFNITNPNFTLAFSAFKDSLNGVVTQDNGTIYRTSNGGASWNNANVAYGKPKYINSSNLVLMGKNRIYRSVNGGQNWTALPIINIPVDDYFTDFHFTDSLNGVLISLFGRTYRTFNGGTNWTFMSNGNTFRNGNHFFDLNRIYSVGNGGGLFMTFDGGISWDAFSIRPFGNANLESIFFVNKGLGYACGSNTMVGKTTNGGATWRRILMNGLGLVNFDIFYDVHFVNANIGWLVGTRGLIFKTTNGGASWNPQVSGTQARLYEVNFLNHQVGYACGESGVTLRTNDGGLTWTNQIINSNALIYKVLIKDEQNAWLSGSNGIFRRTSNGGQNWQTINLSSNQSFQNIQFLDDQHGFISGSSGKYYFKTNDGGLNWKKDSISFTINFPGYIEFKDSARFWVIGNYDIYQTLNGGQTYAITPNVSPTKMFRLDSSNLWVCGSSGYLLAARSNFFNPEPYNSAERYIQGHILKLGDSSCQHSTLTQSVPNRLVRLDLVPKRYGFSDDSGSYVVGYPIEDTTSDAHLKVVPIRARSFTETVTCPDMGGYAINLNQPLDTIGNRNFKLKADQIDCDFLNLEVGVDERIKCQQSRTTLRYSNLGWKKADSAQITVYYPKGISPLGADVAHLAKTDTSIRFVFYNVLPGHSGVINIKDTVSCSAQNVLGDSKCLHAEILPAYNCPVFNWSGAAVTLIGKCISDNVDFGIYNKTAFAMPDSVPYQIYLDSFLVSNGMVKLDAGDSLKFIINPGGKKVFISAVQVQNHPEEAFVTATYEFCGLGNTMTEYFNRFPHPYIENTKQVCNYLTSISPGSLGRALPIGFTSEGILPLGTELEYSIRFQNDRADTAYSVWIQDTLDEHLNIESFRLVSSSSPFSVSVQSSDEGKAVINFRNDTINIAPYLPGNRQGYGFVKFRVSPKEGLTSGTKVRNQARIRFDFDEPIVTRATIRTYTDQVFRDSTLSGNVQLSIDPVRSGKQKANAEVYPNPLQNNILKALFGETGDLRILDATGKLILEKFQLIGINEIPLNLVPGLYFVRLVTGERSHTIKLLRY